MSRCFRLFTAFLIVFGGLLLASAAFAQDNQNKQDQKDKSANPQSTPKETKEQQKKARQQQKNALKELETPYKVWLNEEVAYIITDEERAAFLQLSTNEEREQFIEAFWQKRNPNPDSVENEYKEEHYRRIAYANEHYASGIPGWKTDRGRIYIIWGKPDEIDSHPSGGAYERTIEEGGGSTSTYPFEDWRYRYLPCCGEDVNLEFVDRSGSGEYRLSIDPNEKDALLYVPGAGLTDLEAMGEASKTDRISNPYGVGSETGGAPGAPISQRNNEFEKIELMAKIFAPPPVTRASSHMDEIISARILRNQIHFDYRTDYLRVTSETDLVPVTIQIPNKQLTFTEKEGVHTALLNVYGRVTTLSGRIVQVFEDPLTTDIPESLLQLSLTGSKIYQRALPLRPGLYRLDLVIKDANSGNVGVINTNLQVHRYDEDKLDASSLILADQIERVAANQIGLGMFVLGDLKVRPRLSGDFHTSEAMGLFLQVYNLKVDDKTHKSDVEVHYIISKDKVEKPVFETTETSAKLGQTGDELTLDRVLPLSSVTPGKYKLEIQIKDKVANQDLTRWTNFTVSPAPAPKTTAAAAPGR